MRPEILDLLAINHYTGATTMRSSEASTCQRRATVNQVNRMTCPDHHNTTYWLGLLAGTDPSSAFTREWPICARRSLPMSKGTHVLYMQCTLHTPPVCALRPTREHGVNSTLL